VGGGAPVGGCDPRAGAVGGQNRPAAAATIPGNAIGIGQREQCAGRLFVVFLPVAGSGCPAPYHCPRIFGTSRAIAPETVEAVAEIDIVAPETAFGKNGSDRGGHIRRPLARAV